MIVRNVIKKPGTHIWRSGLTRRNESMSMNEQCPRCRRHEETVPLRCRDVFAARSSTGLLSGRNGDSYPYAETFYLELGM